MKRPRKIQPASIEEMEQFLGCRIDPKMPLEELMCWLTAKIDDERAEQAESERKERGIAVEDLKLFKRVMEPFKVGIGLGDVIEILRQKRQLGHIQQLALETWDRHYAGKNIYLPTAAD